MALAYLTVPINAALVLPLDFLAREWESFPFCTYLTRQNPIRTLPDSVSTLHSLTDGSKSAANVGFAFTEAYSTCILHQPCRRLPSHASSHEAEAVAIREALQYIRVGMAACDRVDIISDLRSNNESISQG